MQAEFEDGQFRVGVLLVSIDAQQDVHFDGFDAADVAVVLLGVVGPCWLGVIRCQTSKGRAGG